MRPTWTNDQTIQSIQDRLTCMEYMQHRAHVQATFQRIFMFLFFLALLWATGCTSRLPIDSTVMISGSSGLGAGVCIEEDTVLTCAHIADDFGLVVMTRDGRALFTQVEILDHTTDVAILHVPDLDLNPVPFGDVQAGGCVSIVGHPLGMPWWIAHGHAAGVYATPRGDMIGIDGLLFPGNSGGPVFNERGELVGIGSLLLNGRMPFAIPVDTIEEVMK